MMEFLHALAPRRDADPSRAVAVVPSRFAAERPMTALPLVAPDVESDGLPPVADSSPGLVEHRVQLPHASPMPGAPMVVTHLVADAQREREPADTSSARVARTAARRNDTSGPVRPMRASPDDVRPPSVGLGHVDSPGREPRDRASATVARGQAIAAAATSPQAKALTTTIATPATTAARAPMSPAFLAARVTRPADRPPVIEVTIDRLEVRAAVPSPRVPPASARRARSPRVPLADYLRGKTGQSGGAA